MANEWAVTQKDSAALAHTFIETLDSTVLMHVIPFTEDGIQKFLIAQAT